MPHFFAFDVARDTDHDGNDDGWWTFPGDSSGSSKPADDVTTDDDDNCAQMALDFGGDQ